MVTMALEDASVGNDVSASFVGVEGGVGGGERDDRGENVSRILRVTVSWYTPSSVMVA